MSEIKVSVDLSSFYLEPENDEGNREYKYRLTGLSDEEISHKVTQMGYRMAEGNGEALYEIGVTDDGCPLGLDQKQLDQTVSILQTMAGQLNATAQVIYTAESPISLHNPTHRTMYTQCNNLDPKSLTREHLDAKRLVCEVLVRQRHQERKYVGLRIAVAGNVDAGKSTTIGVLTNGIKDNGNGSARQHVFNYRHEVESGRTTSVVQEILGFDQDGQVVNERLSRVKAPSWPEIVKASTKICTFFDMAGHERYFNTTIRGISGIYPDYCLIMIGANMGMTAMTREHMVVCLMKSIPMVAVFTKTDMAPEHVQKATIAEFTRLITGPGVNKTPYLINNLQDVINCCRNIASGVIVPMIRVSNVTGENLDLLKTLFNCLPSRVCYHEQLDKPVKYTIQDVFQVPGIGVVVSGLLLSGVVGVKSTQWLGPDRTGRYQRVAIKSIHDKKMEVSTAFAGQNVCFALRGVTATQIRKGMYLMDGREAEPPSMREFTAEIEIFGRHSTSIKTGYEPVVHVGNVRQVAVISQISNVTRKTQTGDDGKQSEVILRAGDRATVTFRFRFYPVFLEKDSKILFREGRTRGVGLITNINVTPPPTK